VGFDMATILLVDDRPEFNIGFLRRFLEEECGHHVLLATDAEQGIALARSAKPDLVVMDVEMYPVDGLEATRRLRADESTRQLPVLALSGHEDVPHRAAALAAGADDYATKPVMDLDRFHDRLQALLYKGPRP
jgi:CheY-like chemotaxis protein